MSNIEKIQTGNVNCYIINNGENSILVDTGRRKYKSKLLKLCRDKNVKAIVLTHGHIDHIMNAAFIQKELNIPIAMAEDDKELIANNMKQQIFSKTFFGYFVKILSIWSFKHEKIDLFEPDIYLHDGESLDMFGIDAKVISLPGHTKGSIGLVVGLTDVIVGDAMMNMIKPTEALIYTNLIQMKESVEKILLEEKMIHVGHGNCFR